MKGSIIQDKSIAFALRIIRLYKYLTITAEQKEYVLSKQLLRSGTSIGANVKEALPGQSRPDFRAKMNIALKEACETEYWLDLLYKSDYINESLYTPLSNENVEIIKILTSIVKNTET